MHVSFISSTAQNNLNHLNPTSDKKQKGGDWEQDSRIGPIKKKAEEEEESFMSMLISQREEESTGGCYSSPHTMRSGFSLQHTHTYTHLRICAKTLRVTDQTKSIKYMFIKVTFGINHSSCYTLVHKCRTWVWSLFILFFFFLVFAQSVRTFRREANYLLNPFSSISSEIPNDAVENGKTALVPARGSAFLVFVWKCVVLCVHKAIPLLLCRSPFFFVFQMRIQVSSCSWATAFTPWVASGPASGPRSWSTWFCCNIECRELILCPRNYDDSVSR